NAGKSDKTLSDQSAIAKAKAQMDELQERREQLELMMEWQAGLANLAEETVERVADYWYKLAPGFTLNENGKQSVRKWLRQFPLDEILKAMDASADTYLVFQENGEVTEESWERAWHYIQGICRVNRASKENP